MTGTNSSVSFLRLREVTSMSEEIPEVADEGTDDESDDEFTLTEQQQQALALDRNVAVTAGAGTGKTTTLAERYRRMLLSDPSLDPENVLTITFTNDAANELEDRIRDTIDEELEAATPETYARWRRAQDGLEDAYIHTIHGFCSRLLREFAVEAGVHPDFDTLDETDAQRVLDAAITTVLDTVAETAEEPPFGTRDQTLGSEDPLDGTQTIVDRWGVTGETLSEDVRRLVQLYPRRRFENLLSDLFDQRPDSVDWAEDVAEMTADEYFEASLDRVEPAFTPNEAETIYDNEAVREALNEIIALADVEHGFSEADDDGQATIELVTEILTQTGAHTADGTPYDRAVLFTHLGNRVTKGSGGLYSSQTWRYEGSSSRWSKHGLEAEHDRLCAALDTLIEHLEPEQRNIDRRIDIARNEAQYTVALARVFQAVLEEYEHRKDRQNALDYSDQIQQAIEFLDDNPTACRELGEQFAYIMVDEVQDTDPRQWEIVKRLSGTETTVFDGQNALLVGDEKQSIYRFRGADVTHFRSSRRELTAANPDGLDAEQDMTTNFRTLDGPLTFINELFERLFRPAGMEIPDNGSVADVPEEEYAPFEATPQWLETGREEGTEIEGDVEYLLVPKTEDDATKLDLPDGAIADKNASSAAEREAYAVAARLSELFESERTIYDPDREEVCPVQPRHVALLFRSTTRVAAFERALEASDIPYTNLAGSGFYETPEIKPLINLLHVLNDPTADIPLYGVLRSPIFGFSDEELVELAATDEPLWVALKGVSGNLDTARQTIRSWRAAAGFDSSEQVISWSTLLSQILEDTGYLASIGADERPQQAIANVEKFRDRIRSWEEGSTLSIARLLDRIETEREADDDPGEATIPGDIDGVQLRTIHSAKGLQFPVVGVPELGREINIESNLPSGHIETIDGEPVLGLKTPDPREPFETVSSPLFDLATAHNEREERAESKRTLYVALTRTRDLLLLSGLHEADEDRESGLAAGKPPAEAKRRTDWLQPLLVEDDSLVEALSTTPSVQRSLGAADYTIHRPPDGTTWRSTTAQQRPPTDIEIDDPPSTQPNVRLTATEFRDYVYNMRHDGASKPTTPGSNDAYDIKDSDTKESTQALDPTVIGDIVHKLCELRLPQAEWPDIIRRLGPDPTVITDEIITQIEEHVNTGLAELEQIQSAHPVEQRFDELQVTARFSAGRIIGDIDHLSVTPTGYHVVDYKTSGLTGRSTETLREYYLPQLRVYACALYQADPSLDSVDLRLVFTDEGETESINLEPADIEADLDRYETILQQY